MERTTIVKVTPQAQSYWAFAEILQSDIQNKIQEVWISARDTRNLDPGWSGIRSQQDAENKLGLYCLYRNLWRTEMWKMVESSTGKRVCFLSEESVEKQGDVYTIGGVIYFNPEVKFKDEAIKNIEDFMQSATKELTLLFDTEISGNLILAEIEEVRKRIQYSTKNTISVIDGKEISLGDVVSVESNNPSSPGVKNRAVVVLSDKCPKNILDGVVGSMVGDSIMITETIKDDKGYERRIPLSVKIIEKLQAPIVSDERLCRELGAQSMEAVVKKVRDKLRFKKMEEYPERFTTQVLELMEIGPIPSAVVWDRAEGAVEYMKGNSSMSEADMRRQMSVPDRDSMIRKMLPKIRIDLIKELACSHLACVSGLGPDEEAVTRHCKDLGMDCEDPAVRHAAYGDLCVSLVLKYCEKGFVGETIVRKVLQEP